MRFSPFCRDLDLWSNASVRHRQASAFTGVEGLPPGEELFRAEPAMSSSLPIKEHTVRHVELKLKLRL